MLAHPDPQRLGQEGVTSTLPWQPVIVGTNTDDWRLFSVFSGSIDQITDQMLAGPVNVYGYQALPAYGLPVDTALAPYRAAYPDATVGDLLAAVQTDWYTQSEGSSPTVHDLIPIVAAAVCAVMTASVTAMSSDLVRAWARDDQAIAADGIVIGLVGT